MSEVKISALPAASSATLADLLPMVQSGVTKKTTVQQLVDLVFSSASIESQSGTLASSTSLPTGQAWGLGSFTITSSGFYIVIIDVVFQSNSNGYRDVELTGAIEKHVCVQAANGAQTRVQVIGLLTSPGTIEVTGKHNSTAETLTATSRYQYIGLKVI